MAGFREQFTKRQKKGAHLCVGLDPLVSKVPVSVQDQYLFEWEMIEAHMITVVDQTAKYACMYKPNRAFYEAVDNGEQSLRKVISYIHKEYPGIPVLLDGKRGDIGNTQKQYAHAHFALDKADGLTFSPYMGMDTMMALRNKSKDVALVGICYTTNPSAREVQNILTVGYRASGQALEYKRLWEVMAGKLHAWARGLNVMDNAGIVMAAAHNDPTSDSGTIYTHHLEQARELVGTDMWFLVPGIGAQGGLLKNTIRAAYAGPGTVAINSSSGICFAGYGEDYAKHIKKAAKKLNREIQETIIEECVE